MKKIVELKKVSKTYKVGENEFKALDGIDLELNNGEFVVILGPSGAGKGPFTSRLPGYAAPGNRPAEKEPLPQDVEPRLYGGSLPASSGGAGEPALSPAGFSQQRCAAGPVQREPQSPLVWAADDYAPDHCVLFAAGALDAQLSCGAGVLKMIGVLQHSIAARPFTYSIPDQTPLQRRFIWYRNRTMYYPPDLNATLCVHPDPQMLYQTPLHTNLPA